jgi:3-hydroxyisobutyrate dehydrogenase
MRIGFIGLGNMGAPMAGHLAKRDHDVVVYDIDVTRAARLAKEIGATVANAIKDVADADIIVTMLPTGRDVRHALVEADDGALFKALHPGTIVIDMSSSEPVGTQVLGAELRKRKAILIDAPVSGGVARAKSATLAIMIGGDDKTAIARARPVLQLMGDRLFETGGLGSGHAMKALNNFVAATSFAATAEAMMIGARFGLDRATMVDIMNVSTGRNFHTDVVMKEHVVGEKFATGFAIGLLAKDVGIAEGLGVAMGVEAPLTELVSRRWASARDKVGAMRDNTEAYLAWSAESDKTATTPHATSAAPKSASRTAKT